MKTNTKSFAVGLLVVGLIQDAGSTAIAVPVSQSRSPQSQFKEKISRGNISALCAVGEACFGLASFDGIAYDNRTFVGVGRNGVVLTSKPGHAWARSNSGIASQLWSAADTDGEPAPQLFSCFIRTNLLATGQPRIIGEINP